MQLEFFGAAGEVTGSCHILCIRVAAQVGRPCQTLDLGRLADGRA
jgi:hypothetical protein